MRLLGCPVGIVILGLIGCAKPLAPPQRTHLLDTLDDGVRATLYDPSRIPDDWLEPARAVAAEDGPSWQHDHDLGKAINECMFRIASHSHIHAPGPAMVESIDLTAPLVTTTRGVSVLRAHQLPSGDIIRPGDVVEGFDSALELREALEEASGDPMPLTILTINGEQRTINWNIPDTKRSDAVSSRLLPDGSLYVRIDAFSGLGPFDSGNAGTIRRHLRDAPGAGQLVIDLRGNPGGGRSAADTAALFVEGHATFALFLSRDDVGRDREVVLKEIRRMDGKMSLLPWDAIPQLLAFRDVMKGEQSFALEFDGNGTQADVDVVVLIDEGTRSAAEMFAGFLQEQGRATLIGRRSAGECALPVTVSLPNGWHAHVAACMVSTGGGNPIEGHGLEPDLAVIHEPADLALGRDRDLEAAMRHFAALRTGRAQAPSVDSGQVAAPYAP
jgi:carboxyl-terminal processing protease